MQRSLLVDGFRSRGARLADRPEAPGSPSALTFGDVPAEYRAGLEGALLLDATDRGRLEVRGKDAAAFLHRLLASDVRGVPEGELRPGLLLSPKGKVRFAFALERGPEGCVLSTPPGTAAGLAAALDAFLFTEDVAIEDTSDGHAPIELVGPRAREVAAAVLGPLPELGEHGTARLVAHVPREGCAGAAAEIRVHAAAAAVAGSPGLRLDAGPGGARALWEELERAGARAGGIAARDMLRVEAGAALFGVDVDEGVYPQEARLERAFSLEKGCYVGQEVVAKIDTYGGLNKRLVALRVDHGDPLPRGARLVRVEPGAEGGAEARDLGVVTSWAWSFALDTGLALAYVKRRHQAAGTAFEVRAPAADGDGAGAALGTATVVALPVREGALPPTGDFE